MMVWRGSLHTYILQGAYSIMRLREMFFYISFLPEGLRIIEAETSIDSNGGAEDPIKL